MLSKINFEDLKIHAESVGVSGFKTKQALVEVLEARHNDAADHYSMSATHYIRDANDADMKRVRNVDSTFVSEKGMYAIDKVDDTTVTVTNMVTGETFSAKAKFVLAFMQGNVIIESPKGETLFLNYPERS